MDKDKQQPQVYDPKKVDEQGTTNTGCYMINVVQTNVVLNVTQQKRNNESKL